MFSTKLMMPSTKILCFQESAPLHAVSFCYVCEILIKLYFICRRLLPLMSGRYRIWENDLILLIFHCWTDAEKIAQVIIHTNRWDKYECPILTSKWEIYYFEKRSHHISSDSLISCKIHFSTTHAHTHRSNMKKRKKVLINCSQSQ